MNKTPILFNVFNRPDNTRQVFEVIKAQKPPILYVHCDGVRKDVATDTERVKEVRNIIENGVDWDCELHTLFRNENFGCGLGPASAITWFFENVDEGIILEDDCLPHPDFFEYCEQLLSKYRDNENIYIIGGTNFNETNNRKYSYDFTMYAGIWGWATWKRTWQKFKFDLDISEIDFKNKITPFVQNKNAIKYWTNLMAQVRNDKNKTYWDYQLHLIMLYNTGIHIRPAKNLIMNIGFGEDATHTTDKKSDYSNKATTSILPLIHPDQAIINRKEDNRLYNITFTKKIKKFIKQIIKNE